MTVPPRRIDSIATNSLSGTLEEKLRASAAAGFDAVEIFENDLLASPLTPRQLRALLDELGLACVLYQPFRDLEGLPEPHRSRAFARLEAKFDVMAELGTRHILLCASCSPHALPDRARVIADLRDAGDLAAKRGITLCYEALAWSRYVNDHREAWTIVKAVDHANVCITLDSFHSLARGIPNESIREIDGARIGFVQLADAPRMSMDFLQWSRHYRNLPGQGDLPVDAYLAEILRAGYRGPVSLEIFNDQFRSSSVQMVAQDAKRSLTFVRERAERLLGEPADMPPPPRVDGVAFVEFAVSPQDTARLEQLFVQLGFSPAGRHRRKQVTRWRRGNANLVINAEENAFAGAFWHTHGTAICAVGVLVDDADATMLRAERLGIPLFEESGETTRIMPALRGVGGSLVYVVGSDRIDALWETEFDAVAQPTDAFSGTVSGFDHLASTVLAEEFLSCKLYWRSLFGCEEVAPHDVIDPSGLVRSQAIESPGRHLRLTLNASDARATLSSRFLSHNFGGGFQHVAFGCDDIFAVANSLRVHGAERLPIPPNYYDDLRSRFDLDDALLQRMRAAGILLDEDQNGRRYWQLYSRAFDKRFFFEFVQRDAGFEGYGAPNAAIRIAAQSRFREDVSPEFL